MEDQILFRLKRGQNDAIYFRLREYKGRKYIDLRLFFKPEDQEEMYPTKKGLAIPLDLFGEFKKAIVNCEKQLTANT